MRKLQYRSGDDWDGKNNPRNPVPQPESFLNPRPLWDAAVARVLRGNPLFQLDRLCRLRALLHLEPHIKGKPK